MRLRAGPFTVANGATLSNALAISEDADFKHMALAGVECPAAVTSASLQVEYSRDGSTYYNARPLGAVDAIPIASADGNGVRCFSPVSPAAYYGMGGMFRLRTASAEGGSRDFYLIFNSVS